MKREFRTHQGEKIKDVIEYLKDYMKPVEGADNKYEIFIGCDSQVNNNHTVYSVVIGIHKIIAGIGRGVHIIHSIEKAPKLKEDKSSVFKRLWGEVDRIVEIALYLRENGIDTKDIGTHVDANGNKKFASNMIYNLAIGYLNSLGFNVEGKPFAWAATYAANKYCRT